MPQQLAMNDALNKNCEHYLWFELGYLSHFCISDLRAARRKWAQEHLQWRRDDWSNILFTDVSCFNVQPDNSGVFIWRKPLLQNIPVFVHGYKDEILRSIVVLFPKATENEFILSDDNAKPHRAELVNSFLFYKGILRTDWPGCSPHINRIEPVWDILGDKGCYSLITMRNNSAV
ncbi:uncharacterized protein LOC118192225 [Stegodyphus dumicola]|uniref:uncharacterized protein LOC118192225 n=1 Tax=Stegodyphus dumicola TaxID=202533 RepID=UPI0015A8ABFF|nr:uncharacterized protein LOC118192225 [Stegodyphus dumicola]XP_035219029.1 uncharacterized protein LOC118192225 [Stegodyphus dumicola]